MAFLLESGRLIMRPFQDSDLEYLVAYRSDPPVAEYQNWNAPYPLEQGRQLIDEMKAKQPGIPGEWYQIALEMKANGEMIGDCVYKIMGEDEHQAYIGYTLSRAFWWQGYASEAVQRLLDHLFRDLGLHRVVAVCDVENTASFRLLERIGFRREAQYLENVWFKGRWCSEYLYALLDREWNRR